jgi:hypothetical protein
MRRGKLDALERALMEEEECPDAVFSSGEQRQQALLRCGLSI